MVAESNVNSGLKNYIWGTKSYCSVIFISVSYFDVLTPVRVTSDYLIFTKNL